MERKELPNRRYSETLHIRYREKSYFLGVGFHEEGLPGDVFIASQKIESEMCITANDACILFSFLLQVGADREDFQEICKMLQKNEYGGPASVIGVIGQQITQELFSPRAIEQGKPDVEAS